MKNILHPLSGRLGQIRLKFRVLGILLLLALTIGSGVACGFVWSYWSETLPETAYAAIQTGQWARWNVATHVMASPNDFAQAEKHLKSMVSAPDYRQNPIPNFLLGGIYDMTNRPAEAIKRYQEAIRLSNRNWSSQNQYRLFLDQSHGALAVIHYKQNHHTAALSELAQIQTLDNTDNPELLTALHDSLEDPSRADFHLLLGKELRHMLELQKAREEFQSAAQLSRSPHLHMEALHWLTYEMPHPSGALSPMARYYSLSGQAMDDNESPKAITFYEKALALNPTFEWGYNELAILYRQGKQYGKAEANAQKAIALNPQFYNSYLTLGDISVDEAHYERAIHWYNAARGIISQFPDVTRYPLLSNLENQLGYTYETMNKPEQATRHYREALMTAAETPEDADEPDDQATSSDDYAYAQEALERLSETHHRRPILADSQKISSL
jgi:tetratricopeptide (TPR) repeat protein